ncbi:GNAT family N-acetyltransferase [Jeongeupia chitinilytica]|uniref:N-acetyltransferase n=1 Tax=Jeongeupia chitinilytica TaxID=1041641 RepID=A0ABQ3H2M2_9NEIS|nr:GNAT family N-acetyltransferase [Jeongeupia chitinilytica]GHD67120.1 N-acetyltransferase [Jeongeupia chitinilytica]
MTTVRHASLDDLDVLVPLFDAYRQFYKQASDVDGVRDYLGERLALRESVLLLAENAGRAVGFVQLFPLFSSVGMRRVWLLNDLFVTDSARGQGVARALMGTARGHAQATGAASLRLSTAHANHAAQALYESLGYQRDTEFQGYALKL